MEMLLMGACLSMFGLAVACLAFGAATRSEEQSQEPARPQPAAQAVQTRFFVDRPGIPAGSRDQVRVPIEVLLLQIENHVRLEQAAAECFLESPTAAVLHSRTVSPLVN